MKFSTAAILLASVTLSSAAIANPAYAASPRDVDYDNGHGKYDPSYTGYGADHKKNYHDGDYDDKHYRNRGKHSKGDKHYDGDYDEYDHKKYKGHGRGRKHGHGDYDDDYDHKHSKSSHKKGHAVDGETSPQQSAEEAAVAPSLNPEQAEPALAAIAQEAPPVDEQPQPDAQQQQANGPAVQDIIPGANPEACNGVDIGGNLGDTPAALCVNLNL
ncbi:hypothetical protein K493DRAFT_302473 [Basidiobolus meristosporus CBS 931.73]|uniref:Uncharacterized protein n=1 Tax=Basidiobolus meristosporus CBS 931.73 TaxID=1314790 RepID=A0A1Y1Y700_9FUNG|nr:hypothetical protein K493DRAFT_302473 [Basidiobolus meristosporus CBS 931.73]|eukprot:ORX93783.1 hypothetical protein K493DRAFT_302473 [Basidiobolus meristosporus CBS 931.73]